jgi:hypothetical protein
MTGCECSGQPGLEGGVGGAQQRLGEELERAGDDDRNGGSYFPNVIVSLHNFLDTGLKGEKHDFKK